jgi:hypothetical protein
MHSEFILSKYNYSSYPKRLLRAPPALVLFFLGLAERSGLMKAKRDVRRRSSSLSSLTSSWGGGGRDDEASRAAADIGDSHSTGTSKDGAARLWGRAAGVVPSPSSCSESFTAGGLRLFFFFRSTLAAPTHTAKVRTAPPQTMMSSEDDDAASTPAPPPPPPPPSSSLPLPGDGDGGNVGGGEGMRVHLRPVSASATTTEGGSTARPSRPVVEFSASANASDKRVAATYEA